jgi:predicted thioesterase
LPPVLATAKAVFTGVEGRRIVFAVTARDETQEIGSGITRARIG